MADYDLRRVDCLKKMYEGKCFLHPRPGISINIIRLHQTELLYYRLDFEIL